MKLLPSNFCLNMFLHYDIDYCTDILFELIENYGHINPDELNLLKACK